MRTKLFFYQFGLPVLFVFILLALFGYNRLFVLMSLSTGLGIILRTVLSGKRYLDHLQIDTTMISIEYLNPFLKRKKIEFHRSEVMDIQLNESSWYSDIRSSLVVAVRSKYYRFTIIGKKFYQDIEIMLQPE
jgi:hypothetical protein